MSAAVLSPNPMGNIFDSATNQLAKSLAASSSSVSWSKVQLLLARAPRLPKLSTLNDITLPFGQLPSITSQLAVRPFSSYLLTISFLLSRSRWSHTFALASLKKKKKKDVRKRVALLAVCEFLVQSKGKFLDEILPSLLDNLICLSAPELKEKVTDFSDFVLAFLQKLALIAKLATAEQQVHITNLIVRITEVAHKNPDSHFLFSIVRGLADSQFTFDNEQASALFALLVTYLDQPSFINPFSPSSISCETAREEPLTEGGESEASSKSSKKGEGKKATRRETRKKGKSSKRDGKDEATEEAGAEVTRSTSSKRLDSKKKDSKKPAETLGTLAINEPLVKLKVCPLSLLDRSSSS